MNPTMVLSIAYVLTELLKVGITWKEILDAVDETGRIDDTLRLKIATDQHNWEAAWKAKRAGEAPE